MKRCTILILTLTFCRRSTEISCSRKSSSSSPANYCMALVIKEFPLPSRSLAQLKTFCVRLLAASPLRILMNRNQHWLMHFILNVLEHMNKFLNAIKSRFQSQNMFSKHVRVNMRVNPPTLETSKAKRKTRSSRSLATTAVGIIALIHNANCCNEIDISLGPPVEHNTSRDE